MDLARRRSSLRSLLCVLSVSAALSPGVVRGQEPLDATLRDAVSEGKYELERIARLVLEDQPVGRITCADSTTGLSPERRRRYCTALRNLGAQALDATDDQFRLVLWTAGERMKGLAHLEGEAAAGLGDRLLDHLDGEARGGTWYLHVTGPWHLVLVNAPGDEKQDEPGSGERAPGPVEPTGPAHGTPTTPTPDLRRPRKP